MTPRLQTHARFGPAAADPGIANVYDGFGRLWQVSGGSAGTTRFVYDGDRLLEEYDGATGIRQRAYAHGPGADEPLIWYQLTGSGPQRRLLHADHQGSIVAVADDYGSAVAINAYDAWGIPNATNLGRFQYTGQTWIAELGMYYYKARFYSPTLGRFMQTDPIGYEDHINLYAYVGNDPINGRDPIGLGRQENCTGSRIDCGGGIAPGRSGSSTSSITGSPSTENSRISKAYGDARDAASQTANRVGRRLTGTRTSRPTSGTWNPRTAWRRAHQIAAEETARTRRIAPTGGHNDVYDAERHARWTYRMAKEIGPYWSDLFSGTREYIEEIGVRPQDSREFFMDTHNNALGIRAARNGQPIPTISTPGLIYMRPDGEYYAQ